MHTYTVNHDYHSVLCDIFGLGRLAQGQSLELEDDVAESINDDSPGTLTKYKAPAARKSPTKNTRQVKKADKDR